MRRKNILWGFVLLVVAMACCYVFSACGDDNEESEPQNALVGAWEYVHNPQVSVALEQMIAQMLQENQTLTPENIQILTKVKEIISTHEFIIQFQNDGVAKLYTYGNMGIGVFITGSWLETDKAVILYSEKLSNISVAATDIQIKGSTLTCKIGQLPLTFTKVKNKK